MESDRVDLVFELIKERRSIRSYLDIKVPKAMLERLLEVGQWAPSPSNVQSWRFVVVQDAGQLRALATLSPGFPKTAVAAIVICSDERDVERFSGTTKQVLVAEEAAMAAQNILLAAHALGFGSCVVASFSVVGITALLAFPGHIRPILIVALGFSTEEPLPPKRKALSQITLWESFREA